MTYINFTLNPQLVADTSVIGDLPLCRILLMNNAHFPWLILVPKREGMRELFDLSINDYNAVMDEVRHASNQFSILTNAHKINVACLGNIVEQLHIHIIARYKNDAAWPQPVWNCGIASKPYVPEEMAKLVAKFRPLCGL